MVATGCKGTGASPIFWAAVCRQSTTRIGGGALVDSASSGYSPSPRPTYDAPTLVRRSDIKHHIWGDKQSGLVGDWLYASTDKVHVLEFGLAARMLVQTFAGVSNRVCRGRSALRIEGAMLACNPQTGEVVECLAGESLFFRKDTWHHIRAQGAEPLRVLEFFAPPPSQGTSGAYAMKQNYLETPVYRRNELLGNYLGAATPQTLHRIGTRERSLRLEGEIVVGLIVSTEYLTVAELQVPAGAAGEKTAHGGDAMIIGLLRRADDPHALEVSGCNIGARPARCGVHSRNRAVRTPVVFRVRDRLARCRAEISAMSMAARRAMRTRDRQGCVLGIDVGGTSIRAGLFVPRSGAIRHVRAIRTDASSGGRQALARAADVACEVVEAGSRFGLWVEKVGIGVPELVGLTGEIESRAVLPWRSHESAKRSLLTAK